MPQHWQPCFFTDPNKFLTFYKGSPNEYFVANNYQIGPVISDEKRVEDHYTDIHMYM